MSAKAGTHYASSDDRFPFTSSAIAPTHALANIKPHRLYERPWPATHYELVQRLDGLLNLFAVNGNAPVLSSDGTPWSTSSRIEFVQRARAMREELGVQVWTPIVAAKFGSLLSACDFSTGQGARNHDEGASIADQVRVSIRKYLAS
jgi:hypothetical protein